MASKDRTPKSSQSKHALASTPFITPSQAQLTYTTPGSWHQQGKSTEPLIPCPLHPQCLLHWNVDVQTNQPKNPLRLCPASASCRREVGENFSFPKVIILKPSPCRQETLRGLHLPVRRCIISLEHVQLIILMGSIFFFEIRAVCSSQDWYLFALRQTAHGALSLV